MTKIPKSNNTTALQFTVEALLISPVSKSLGGSTPNIHLKCARNFRRQVPDPTSRQFKQK